MLANRLQLFAFVGVVAALPEAAVRSSDQQVAFQAMLVVQLLGVIVAAIAVAAAFSALGLAVVWRASRPLQQVPSTFVAWAFLRAPRQTLPWPLRVWATLMAQVGGTSADAPTASARRLVGGLVWVALGSAVVAQTAEAGAHWPTLALRNTCAGVALHGLLLTVAGLPQVRLRQTLTALIVLAVVLGAGWAGRHPQLLPLVDPLALLSGLALFGALALGKAGDAVGQSRRLAARIRWLGPMALVVLGAGIAVRLILGPLGAAVAILSVGAAAAAVVLYLAVQGQNKVTVPVFVSIVGVAAGTWALIVVLSVMGGFAADLRTKMLVANAHALIETPGRANAFGNADQLSERLRAVAGVAAVSPQVRGDAILSSSFNVHNFVGIRGIDPEEPAVVRDMQATLRTGSLDLLRNATGLGSDRSLQRRPVGLASDIPPTPSPRDSGAASPGSVTTTAQPASDDEAVLRALGQLPPGPSAAQPPQTNQDLPKMLLLGSDGEKLPTTGGAPNQRPPAADQELATKPEQDLGSEPIGPRRPVPAIERPGHIGGMRGLLGDDDDLAAANSDLVDAPVPPGLLVGVELARTLQAEVGDKIEVVTPDGDIGPTGMRPRVRTFRLAGTFETGLYEADSKVAYMAIDEAARYFNLDGEANVLELRLIEPESPDAVLEQVRQVLVKTPPPMAADAKALQIIDWRQLNRSLFSALAFERLVIFLVLGLIILVAAFSIVSALTMVILQKHDSIAMLRAMGAHAGAVQSAFVQMGGAIGVIGTTAGLVLGIGTCTLVEVLGIQLPEAYYVRTLPVRLHAGEIAAVIAVSMAISLVATIFPARGAARLQPLEGLRHG
ncbi:MAG: ABC transporter permease [Myxococcales bacterium]|nr:ABC transporter permease [Myxococcales bacterium]